MLYILINKVKVKEKTKFLCISVPASSCSHLYLITNNYLKPLTPYDERLSINKLDAKADVGVDDEGKLQKCGWRDI